MQNIQIHRVLHSLNILSIYKQARCDETQDLTKKKKNIAHLCLHYGLPNPKHGS